MKRRAESSRPRRFRFRLVVLKKTVWSITPRRTPRLRTGRKRVSTGAPTGATGVASAERARGRPQVWAHESRSAQLPTLRLRRHECLRRGSAVRRGEVRSLFAAPPQPAACANSFASSLAAARRATERAARRAESQRAPANVCARWKKKSFWCISLFTAGLGGQPVT